MELVNQPVVIDNVGKQLFCKTHNWSLMGDLSGSGFRYYQFAGDSNPKFRFPN